MLSVKELRRQSEAASNVGRTQNGKKSVLLEIELDCRFELSEASELPASDVCRTEGESLPSPLKQGVGC